MSKTGTNISEDGTLSERGFCVKVYDHGKAAEYSFSAIEEDTVDEVFGEIAERLDTLGKTLPDGVTAFAFDGVEDEVDLVISNPGYAKRIDEVAKSIVGFATI